MTKDIIIVIGILKTPVAVFLLQPSSLQKHIVPPFYKESETIIRVIDWIKKAKHVLTSADLQPIPPMSPISAFIKKSFSSTHERSNISVD